MHDMFSGRSMRLSMGLTVCALAAVTLLGAEAQAPAAPTFDRIAIDTAVVTRTVPSTFFGVNYVGFWDSKQGSAASALALARTPIKLVRFPGGDPGDWYDWADPSYKGWSATSPLGLWRYARRFGGVALFQTNYQGHVPNPPGEPYAVNSAQNAAAWVRYNRAQGIRAIMEVGNEEDLKVQHASDPGWQSYIAAFNAQARAMHAVDRQVMVIGPAGTNEWQWWGLDSLGTFLARTGNRSGTGQVDGISLHFYKGATWDDSKGVPQYWASSGGPWTFIKNAILRHDRRNLPVYITEWNVGAAHVANDFNRTLGHALVSADMIGAFAQTGVSGEVYFAIHGGDSFGILYQDGESRPVDTPTPTYYAMALWSRMGDRMVRSTASADPAAVVSSYATTRPDGSVQVLAINKSAQMEPLSITFQHVDPRGHVLRADTLRGQRDWSDRTVTYNGVQDPSPAHSLPAPRVVGRVGGRAIAYTLPPYSATVLEIAAH